MQNNILWYFKWFKKNCDCNNYGMWSLSARSLVPDFSKHDNFFVEKENREKNERFHD